MGVGGLVGGGLVYLLYHLGAPGGRGHWRGDSLAPTGALYTATSVTPVNQDPFYSIVAAQVHRTLNTQIWLHNLVFLGIICYTSRTEWATKNFQREIAENFRPKGAKYAIKTYFLTFETFSPQDFFKASLKFTL